MIGNRTDRSSMTRAVLLHTARAVACASLFTWAASCRSAADPAADAMECLDRLLVPRYPPIASSARISIEGLGVTVHLNADGAVQSLAFNVPAGSENKAKLFTPSLEQDVRASTFRRGCQDSAVNLVFDFRLSTQAETDGRAAFRAPDHVEVFDSRPVVQ
jgi:hypothetical protein